MEKDAVHDLTDLRMLISRAEALVTALEKMIPPKNVGWLEWRHRSLVRRLEDAKREVHNLTEMIQVRMIEEKVNGVSERYQNTATKP